MNKKGSSVTDVFLIIIVLFAFGMVSLISYVMFTEYNDNYQARTGVSTEAKAMIQENKDDFVGVTDGLTLFIVVGLTIALIAGATMVNTHPAFFIVALIVTAIAIFFGAVYSNAYETFVADPTVAAVEGEYTILPTIMGNLPIIIAVIAFLVAVTLYSRSQGGEL